ncbi:MAG: pilus assembly protein PilP [Magnetococcus sp. YQC-3]
MKLRTLFLIGALLPGNSSLAEEGTTKPVAATETTETFIYDAQNRRDPFRPPAAVVLPDGQQKRNDARVKEFLESLQLDSLKLVAIILKGNEQSPASAGGGPIAMVEDPDGTGHLVRVGSYIGVNEGRIIQIRDGEVIIEESSPPGEPTPTHTITLQLHKAEEPGRENAQTGKKN